MIEYQGYYIAFNPPGDGSCQFAALASQLSGLGIFKSPEKMRKNVAYMKGNFLENDDFPFLEFIPKFNSSYLQHMVKSAIDGDQQTLDVNIHVVSTLGPGAAHTCQPVSSNASATIYLGHTSENHLFHESSLTMK